MRCGVFLRARAECHPVMTLAAIVLRTPSCVQILGALAVGLNVQWPAMLSNVLEWANNICNVDIIGALQLGCVVGASFYARFLFYTCGPLLVAALLAAAAKARIRCCGRRFDSWKGSVATILFLT